MPTHCDIRFDNPSGVYYAGQELSGTAHLTTDHDKTIRAVHIEINGYAKVKWSETKTRTENGKTKTYKVYYTAHEQYLASRTYALGHEGGPSITLTPGSYQYQFRCALPPQLPTTFDGQYGRICYEVQLTIDRPFRFDNVFKQAFTVLHPFDLNFDPGHRVPSELTDDKTFCCCCCESGPLEVKFRIPQSGFAPGQKINFILFLANESTTDIDLSTVGLRKEITYEAQSPSRKQKFDSEYLVKKSFGNVLRLSRKEFRDNIIVPAVPPTSGDTCKCIRINYYLVAKVTAGGCHGDLKLVIPITIGTVPLVNMTPVTPTPPVITEQPGFGATAPFLPSASVEGDVPPSYDTIGIHIHISGYAKVRWRDDRASNTRSMYRRPNRYFLACEQYLSSKTYVLGELYGTPFTLNPGTYQHTFQCHLPSHLPTSFVGLLGQIRYEVVLTVERPFEFDNIFKQAFTVIGPLDLNLNPAYRMPAEKIEEKTFFCCCCTSGPMVIKLSIPHTGYAPGQKISIKLSLNNNSNVDIHQIYVGFKKEITYESENPSRRQKRTLESIAKKYFGSLLRFSNRDFRAQIVLPPLPPSTLDSFKLIRFSYYLYAFVLTEGFHNNARIVIPVTIGTIPLVNQTPIPQTPGVILEQPIYTPRVPFLTSTSLEGDIPPSYDSIQPPTYEEAVANIQLPNDDEERHKSGPFVPKYPVYYSYNCDDISDTASLDEQ